MLEIDGEQVSLMDIAGIDMSGVEEVRSTTFPAGLFEFKCTEAKLDVRESKKGDKAVVAFTLETMNVKTLVSETDNNGKSINPEDLIGRKHVETFWITNPAEDLGRVVAFLNDTGLQATGSLQELLDAMVDHSFQAVMSNKKDKNDSDIVYANLNRTKIAPIAPATV